MNTDILPDGADTRSLGSAALEWKNLYIGDAGNIYFGKAQDSYLGRYTTGKIKLTGSLLISGASTFLDFGAKGTASTIIIRSAVSGDSEYRLLIQADGTILLGSGSAAADVNLYRSAAHVLKTDDALDAASFKAGGVAGVDGSFTTADGKTVTVTKGIITSIV